MYKNFQKGLSLENYFASQLKILKRNPSQQISFEKIHFFGGHSNSGIRDLLRINHIQSPK